MHVFLLTQNKYSRSTYTFVLVSCYRMSISTKPLSKLIGGAANQLVLRRNISGLKKLDVTVFKEKDDKETLYKIKLGDSILKTPGKRQLILPDESLALAIANEWKSEMRKKKISLTNMHLTTLAYTAIDNPFGESKEDVVNSIIEYLKFDTIRFRDVDNDELLSWQSRHWDPLVGWFEHQYNCHLPIDYSNFSGSGSVPQATTDTMLRHLSSHERWPLVGLNFVARNLKSLILTACLMERFLKVDKAVELSRLETRFQIDKWAKVEWEHDLDEQCTNARVAAGTLFYHLTV